jgi:ABC-type multidrug transport system permease subunit
MLFDLHFFMARDGEHFSMCFLAICISSFEKVLFSSVAHFFIGSLIFFGEFSFLSSLFLVISPLSDV